MNLGKELDRLDPSLALAEPRATGSWIANPQLSTFVAKLIRERGIAEVAKLTALSASTCTRLAAGVPVRWACIATAHENLSNEFGRYYAPR